MHESLAAQFKPESKSSGEKLSRQGKVSLSGQSDTSLTTTLRTSTRIQIRFQSEGISDTNLRVSCGCPAGRRARLCKHVWAAILLIDQKFPDFLNAKTSVSIIGSSAKENSPASQDRFSQKAEQRKQSQSLYRKVQYQAQKLRAKKMKIDREHAKARSAKSFSPNIEASLSYFALNGFPMKQGPCETTVAEAKKKLSRIFHPDRGGSHEEMVELNHHCERIRKAL